VANKRLIQDRMHGLAVVEHALGVACRQGAWCLGIQVGHRPIVSVLAQLAGFCVRATAGSPTVPSSFSGLEAPGWQGQTNSVELPPCPTGNRHQDVPNRAEPSRLDVAFAAIWELGAPADLATQTQICAKRRELRSSPCYVSDAAPPNAAPRPPLRGSAPHSATIANLPAPNTAARPWKNVARRG
jgi:hypothetical protein